ncbi:uncharacterized protein [Mytilus edulis]|uniref:uncharacterized protein n=1 Tax=Mytilus edulis TaxID=6550 RepID=UPI0039EF20D1
MEAKFCEPCTARGRNPTAFKWCCECEEALCSECTEAHRVQKMTRNHNLVEISKIPERINISYNCSKHQHLPFDYLCVDHDEICCKECMSQNHRACKNTTFVELASTNFKHSQSFIDSEEQLSSILEALEKLSNNCKENKNRLEQQDTEIRKEILKTKEHIIKQLESLEKSLLKHLSETKDKNVIMLNRQEKDIGDLVTSSKAEKEVLEFVRDHCSEKKAFVSIHSSKPVFDEIENKIKQLSESFADINLTFVESVAEQKITNLGSIALKETPCSFLFVPYKQRQSQVPVVPKRPVSSFTHLYDINMKREYPKGVTGITISENNTLIFCVVNTKKVYFCDKNDSYQSYITCPHAPWDIVAIPGTTTAVMSCRFVPFIQFLDVGRRKLVMEVEMKQSESVGIAATKDNIFVATEETIEVLDLKGNLKRSISLKHKPMMILYISVFSNGNICYSTRSEVHCITSNGCPIFCYASSNLRFPRNTITDNGDNIYVLDCDSHNIHQLTSIGTLVGTLLTDSLSIPHVFCFSLDLSKVYIANKSGQLMSVYKTNF